jgi:hypothetical protein
MYESAQVDSLLVSLFSEASMDFGDSVVGGERIADESTVRERLHILIDGGVLPRVRPNRIWAGPCREAHPCTACGRTIPERETEFDVLTPAGVMIFLHPRCINLWPDKARAGDGSPVEE